MTIAAGAFSPAGAADPGLHVDARRRGACPSLSAPMETGDGLLVRLTPRTGALSLPQLAALAAAATAHGNGLLEVSARGNIQIRGVRSATLEELRDAVNAAGILPREGVPIDINPLTDAPHRDGALEADPAPLALHLSDALGGDEWPARLGPKVAVVIDGGGHLPLASLLADVRLDAADGLWQVALAGRRADAVPLGRGTASEAVAVALDALRRIAVLGPAARARDLGPADHAALRERLRAAGILRAPSTPAIGAVRLATGMAAALALPFGAITGDALGRLAALAAAHAAISVHPAAGRRLVFVFDGDADAFVAAAAGAGLVVDGADPRLAIAVCAGRPACASAYLDTRAAGARLAAALTGPPPGPIHISGCAKGCARPPSPVAEVIGSAGGPQITAPDPALAEALRLAAEADTAA